MLISGCVAGPHSTSDSKTGDSEPDFIRWLIIDQLGGSANISFQHLDPWSGPLNRTRDTTNIVLPGFERRGPHLAIEFRNDSRILLTNGSRGVVTFDSSFSVRFTATENQTWAIIGHDWFAPPCRVAVMGPGDQGNVSTESGTYFLRLSANESARVDISPQTPGDEKCPRLLLEFKDEGRWKISRAKGNEK
ncbi:MAG TPA: hypothetical protein VM889_12030 [Candidatus Thermoplasmatota archaeon]|nr:hypothetical protein [Candidatus Thermoplasmatota archaeon]